MKHRFAIAILLLFAVCSWAEIHGSFQVGNYIEEPSVAFTRIELEWLIIWPLDVSFYGGWQTWFEHQQDKITQLPFQDLYFIGARAEWHGWFIGIEHGCLHPVIGGSSYFDLKRGDTLTFVSAGVYW